MTPTERFLDALNLLPDPTSVEFFTIMSNLDAVDYHLTGKKTVSAKVVSNKKEIGALYEIIVILDFDNRTWKFDPISYGIDLECISTREEDALNALFEEWWPAK